VVDLRARVDGMSAIPRLRSWSSDEPRIGFQRDSISYRHPDAVTDNPDDEYSLVIAARAN